MQNVCARAVRYLMTSISGFAAGILDTRSDVCECVCPIYWYQYRTGAKESKRVYRVAHLDRKRTKRGEKTRAGVYL